MSLLLASRVTGNKEQHFHEWYVGKIHHDCPKQVVLQPWSYSKCLRRKELCGASLVPLDLCRRNGPRSTWAQPGSNHTVFSGSESAPGQPQSSQLKALGLFSSRDVDRWRLGSTPPNTFGLSTRLFQFRVADTFTLSQKSPRRFCNIWGNLSRRNDDTPHQSSSRRRSVAAGSQKTFIRWFIKQNLTLMKEKNHPSLSSGG